MLFGCVCEEPWGRYQDSPGLGGRFWPVWVRVLEPVCISHGFPLDECLVGDVLPRAAALLRVLFGGCHGVALAPVGFENGWVLLGPNETFKVPSVVLPTSFPNTRRNGAWLWKLLVEVNVIVKRAAPGALSPLLAFVLWVDSLRFLFLYSNGRVD